MSFEVQQVRFEPMVQLLTLTEGCTPGRWEAAEAFADAITELRRLFPGKHFQLLPFSFDTVGQGEDPALDAILAVAD